LERGLSELWEGGDAKIKWDLASVTTSSSFIVRYRRVRLEDVEDEALIEE